MFDHSTMPPEAARPASGHSRPASFCAREPGVVAATKGGWGAGIYNGTFEESSFYLPMRILTVKSFSFADAIDDLSLASDSGCRRSIAKPRIPDPAFAALPAGRR